VNYINFNFIDCCIRDYLSFKFKSNEVVDRQEIGGDLLYLVEDENEGSSRFIGVSVRSNKDDLVYNLNNYIRNYLSISNSSFDYNIYYEEYNFEDDKNGLELDVAYTGTF